MTNLRFVPPDWGGKKTFILLWGATRRDPAQERGGTDLAATTVTVCASGGSGGKKKKENLFQGRGGFLRRGRSSVKGKKRGKEGEDIELTSTISGEASGFAR